jgi:ABC-type branched-subunit amino acid transport system substrate-binding protein
LNNPQLRHTFSRLALLILIPILAGCGQTASTPPTIGILSGADTTTLAVEQTNGYSLTFDENASALQTRMASETGTQDDLQKSIRALVEGNNQGDETPVVAILGATTNEATTRTAALVNFFNVPMIIPTAGGDNLVPSNNLWAFRLSAPGSSYADYFFNNIVNKTSITKLGIENNTLSKFKIAILYEQNTFGESAAVASAEAAMAQKVDINPDKFIYGMEIAVYGSFPDKTLDNERLNDLVGQVKEQNAQLVYLITSNPQIASRLVQLFREKYGEDETPRPVLVGQAGAFASQEFAKLPEAQDVIILRQQWNRERCPQNISSFYQAQAYGGAYLLNFAIQQVKETQPAPAWSLRPKIPTELRAEFREALREKLKTTQTFVPCFGAVSFDNTGQNRELNFEFIAIKNGLEQIVPVDDFLKTLKQRILVDENF